MAGTEELKLMSRDHVLHKVRTALGRSAGQKPSTVPETWIRIPDVQLEERVDQFCAAFEALNGKTHRVGSVAEARGAVERILAGRTGIASNAPLLAECRVPGLAGVQSGLTDRVKLREACATVGVGITSANYVLADTGTFVMFSSQEEARMISLLPPAHIAVVRREIFLTGLDELLSLVPVPSELSSSMVFITGPSRTADIEQILVRGVHGPGEIHAVII
jgi:L-lactate dehydrogenase complex protein LldG